MRGSRNIFTVRPDRPLPSDQGPVSSTPDQGSNQAGSGQAGAEIECRIKGKVLKNREGYYNPLAPGDRVILEDPVQGKALILEAEERKNYLTRFNQKGGKRQVLAANLDCLLCVTTPVSPPFRPRFLDRILVQSEIAGLRAIILCNKYDLLKQAGPYGDGAVEERLEDYVRIGYEVMRVSARTGWGMDTLRSLTAGKISVLLGQSGVGKSSIINALAPGTNMKTGGLNEKYHRGNHTTSLSVMLETSPATYVIDTPGIRRMVPDGIGPGELALYMREFAPLQGRCTYGLSCSHLTEPGCKVLEALRDGRIHPDRYESFVRLRDELASL
jgi:ribosome biogenesis GTPase